MGNFKCTQACSIYINDWEILKQDPRSNFQVVKIQKLYRGYTMRIKFNKRLREINAAKLREETMLKTKEKKFKASWDFFFSFSTEYPINLDGLNQLKDDLWNYYNDFFDINWDEDHAITAITYTRKHFRGIESNQDFYNVFRRYLLYVVSKTFNINEFNISMRFYLENLKGGKKKERSNEKDHKEINILFNLNSKDIAMDSGFEAYTILKNYQPNYILVMNYWTKIEKDFCFVTSFQDTQINTNKQLYYQGAVKIIHGTITEKYGLGQEYFIDWDSSMDIRYKYWGYFEKNKYNGWGILIKENKECYYGEYHWGKKYGYGILVSPLFTYRGFFLDDSFEGYGTLTKKNGYIYTGSFKNGLFHGIGRLVLLDTNNSCVGEFEKGKLNGRAYYKWNNEESYYGDWVDGKRNGEGEFHYNSGDYFQGHYKDDLKNGDGSYYFIDGSSWKGKWINGKKEGNYIWSTRTKNPKTLKYESSIFIVNYLNDIQFN